MNYASLLRFMHFITFILLLIPVKSAFAIGLCTPSSSELQFVNIVHNLYRNQLWGNYPSQTRFAVADIAVGSPGFFITKADDEDRALISSDLGNTCGKDSNLVQIAVPLQKGATGYYPNCSPVVVDDPKVCSSPLKQFYEKLGLPMGFHIIDRHRIDEVQSMLFGTGKKYSELQMMIYHSLHEMFHNYQDEVGMLKKAKVGGSRAIEIYKTCLTNDSRWSDKYKKERKWWAANLAALYNPKTSQAELLKIANTFLGSIRPSNPENAQCDDALAFYELHEGTAHFIGDLALLRSGTISFSDLAVVDGQYLLVPPEVHNTMYVYATGGAISMLLQRLAGSLWHGIAESGQAPYTILSNYLKKWLPQVQAGSTWGRNAVSTKDQIKNPKLLQAALSVAEFKRGTAFYIGKHGGRHLMVTNAHVVAGEENLPDRIDQFMGDQGCKDEKKNIVHFKFALAGFEAECKQVLKIIPSLELSFVEMTVPSQEIESELSKIGIQLPTGPSVNTPNQLVVFGYGHFMNPGIPNLSLMMSTDSDCRSFSDVAAPKLIKDPDSTNSLHKVHSFVMGCDVVSGDSGSPVLDLKDGNLIGIAWAGKFPKKNISSDEMQLKGFWNSDLAWSQLNFAVPATLITKEIP